MHSATAHYFRTIRQFPITHQHPLHECSYMVSWLLHHKNLPEYWADRWNACEHFLMHTEQKNDFRPVTTYDLLKSSEIHSMDVPRSCLWGSFWWHNRHLNFRDEFSFLEQQQISKKIVSGASEHVRMCPQCHLHQFELVVIFTCVCVCMFGNEN